MTGFFRSLSMRQVKNQEIVTNPPPASFVHISAFPLRGLLERKCPKQYEN
jgi:hypothetical protein